MHTRESVSTVEQKRAAIASQIFVSKTSMSPLPPSLKQGHRKKTYKHDPTLMTSKELKYRASPV